MCAIKSIRMAMGNGGTKAVCLVPPPQLVWEEGSFVSHSPFPRFYANCLLFSWTSAENVAHSFHVLLSTPVSYSSPRRIVSFTRVPPPHSTAPPS